MTPRDIFGRFISVGDNCEFGLAQTNFGFQPFSLLAFAFNTLSGLMLALSDRLREIGDPERFDLAPTGAAWGPDGSKEYILTHKTYGTIFHTNRHEGTHDAQDIMKLQIDRLAYLADEFINDISGGDRIAVFKSNQAPSYEAIRNLQDLIFANYGPTRLLWVAVAECSELIGAVHPLGEGLLKGYVGRFANYDEAFKFAADDWLKLCANTLELLDNGRVMGRSNDRLPQGPG